MKDIDFDRNLIALLQLKGVGRQKIKNLIAMVNQPQRLSFSELVEFGQMFQLIPLNINLQDQDNAIAFAEKIMESCIKHKIGLVSYGNEKYPSSMNFTDAPVLLYYQGDLECLNHDKRVAVIGSREPTQSGADFAYESGSVLAEENYIVISGLATGCDFYGHMGCLRAGGKAVAFLPAGLMNVYPAENRPLAGKIIENGGCLLSEYAPMETVKPYRFVERDRLQSASSLFVVVSSFSAASGTIHTLNYAKKYNKKIFSTTTIFEESRDGFDELDRNKVLFEIYEKNELYHLMRNINK